MAETHDTDSRSSLVRRLWEGALDLIFPRRGYAKEVSTLNDERISEMLRVHNVGGTVTLFSYKDELVRHMVWLLKYKGDRRVAKLFAGALYDYLLEELSDVKLFDEGQRIILIPLPLSKKRERERGFNQMKLVLNELQKLGEFRVDTKTLVKIRHTAPQTTLKRKEERRKNVEGVFEVQNGEALKDARVILIDDVITTGSTMNEAKKTLRLAGVKDILCIALTH